MPLNTLTATCQLLVKNVNFSYYISLNSFMLITRWHLNEKLNDPADTSLKENPLIYTTVDPC